MVHAVIYAMRGWIAFVAFIDFSNAIRCFADEKDYLQGNLFVTPLEQDPTLIISPTMARLMGRYCLLNGVVMCHCALCIDHLPIRSLSICSLTLSILLYGSEAFYYYTANVGFYVVFPIFIGVFTIVCLCIAPLYLEEKKRKLQVIYTSEEDEDDDEDYETKLIRKKSQTQAHPNLANRLKKTQ